MNYLQKAGKSKSWSSSKSKKRGNFIGNVEDSVAPIGWENFATAETLVGMVPTDSALREKKSEKSSAKKGGSLSATSSNLKNKHPYKLLLEIRPDVDNEALEILKNHRYLTNAFLRLYNYAYNLDQEQPDKFGLRKKLNNLLKKEIEYRKKLSKIIHNEGIKQLIEKSIISLIELGSKGILGIEQFQTYYENMQRLQPNWNNSSINKTLANINSKFSNKNKYPN
jgi:hypothetical protein